MRWRGRGRWDYPVRVCAVTLRNPVIASSGTYGHGLEYARYGDPAALGAIVVKSLTSDARPGFAAPRVQPLAEPGSMVNAVGVANPGVRAWAENQLPALLDAGANVVASVWGESGAALIDAATLLARYRGPVAWELNLSCPNSEHGGPPVAHDANAASEVCAAARALAPDDVAVWAKLAPDAPDIVGIAEACAASGADALTVSNTYPLKNTRFAGQVHLGGGTGGLSGAALRDFVRPLVEKVTAAIPDVAVIACGGVTSSVIALDYLDIGASAVQVGTASLYDPRACHKIARGLVRRLRARG